MRVNRRDFLRSAGTGALGLWVVPLVPWRALAQESIREPFDPRLWQGFLSVCRQCPQGCGVLAEVLDGKVKKVRGNPLHPTNRGTLCARGVSATQLLYNPDRIRTPLRRLGERGSGRWEPISWDDALGTLTTRLVALREAGRSHELAIVSEQLNGLEGILARRFCRAFGTPNFLDLSQYPQGQAANAGTAMQGVVGPLSFDIRNASYLVSFNTPFLEAARNPIQTWQGFAEFRAGKDRPRGRFVHFSPVRDLTASKADEWIPIRPGSEGAVALGMAYVILQEGLYDHAFVKHRCEGFEDWTEAGEELVGFHRHVREKYKPARVAELSGVPAEKIIELARQFATARAPLALWQEQVGVAAQPLKAQMAVHSLNALVGNIDSPGGVLVPRSLPDDLPGPLAEDAASRAALDRGGLVGAKHTGLATRDSATGSAPQRILEGPPYDVGALIVYRANPVFDQINGPAYREALQKIPFSVCVQGIHNDTSAWCDMVLPESHALESWCAGINYTDGGHPFFNLAEPVIPPRHDTRSAGDLILELARRCGGAVAKSLPWARFQDAAFSYLGVVNGLKAGDVFGRPYEETWTRLLERIGWRARGEEPDASFWRDCLESGGWWDPIYFHGEWDRSVPTASGRFEFCSRRLRERAKEDQSGSASGVEEHRAGLPNYEPAEAEKDATAFPVRLLVHALPHLQQVESANQPWLQEICGLREREHWMTWLDVNPEDAAHLHLHHGSEVWIESPQGKAKVKCRINRGIQAGTARVAFGLGHGEGGRWMKDIGVAPTPVISAAFDRWTGTPLWQTTQVRLQKV